MKMLSIVCTKKLEYVVRRCVMPLLIPFLIVNVISCGDDFVEDTGGGSIPPEEIITPPVYMLLDGPYKSGVVLTRNEDDSYIIETIDGDPWVTGGRFKEDIPKGM